MKKIRLIECVFLLLILCACTTQPAIQPESKNPITKVPEQAESQSTALAFGNSESREQADTQDSQSENVERSVFTGGITLYANSGTGQQRAGRDTRRAVCGKRQFLHSAAICRGDDGVVVSGTGWNCNACIIFAPDHAYDRRADDLH